MTKRISKVWGLAAALLCLCALILCFTLRTPAATSGTTGDCTWELNGTELTISGNGAMADYSSSSALPWGISITKVTISDGVTKIGTYAFYKCTGLTSVTIPDSVTEIGSYAFNNCTGLTRVIIFDLAAWCKISFGNYAANPLYYAAHLYLNGTEVKDLVIPAGVTKIGAYTFYGCVGLTSVTIPDNVTEVGLYAFWNCTGLTNVAIPDSVTKIVSYAFSSCTGLTSVTIGNGVIEIGSHAFHGCTALASMTIPDNVTKIGECAFLGCTGLTKVNITDLAAWCKISFGDDSANPLYYAKHLHQNGTEIKDLVIPADVTVIGPYAFSGCTGLTSITIPDSVTSIGGDAFSGCTELKSVTVGNGVTGIASDVFEECAGLIQVNIFDLAAWCKISFWGAYANPLCYAKHLYLNGTEIKDLVIPADVTKIKSYAFFGFTGLASVTVGNGVTEIGERAFWNCTGLTGVTIPDNVTKIGEYAFRNCTGLTSVTIPDSVTSIGSSAFYGCTGLTIYCEATSKPSGWNSDWNYSNCPVVWGDFFPAPLSGTVTVTGKKTPGSVLTAAATNLPEDATYKYQWYRGSTAISGATAATYMLTAEDVGQRIACVLTGTGNYSGTISSNAISCEAESLAVTSNGNGTCSVTGLGNFTGTDLVIPSVSLDGERVTSIKSYAFRNCTGLTSVTIPDSVTSIGLSAFSGCSKLTKVNISDLTAWCEISFGDDLANPLCFAKHLYLNGAEVKDLVIPDSVTEIESYAFYCCTGLTNVTIPDSVTSIGSDAFKNCTGLTSVTIPDSVTSIGESAFYNCAGLTSITIPNNVTSIESYTFQYCTGLTSVEIPNRVTSIGLYAFDGCSRLTRVNIFDLAAWCKIYFESNPLLYAKHLYLNGVEVKDLVIPNGVTSIESNAFSRCTGLTSVTIPDGVTRIGKSAFFGCSGLTKVNITDLAAWCKISFGDDFANPLYYAKHLHQNGTEIKDLVIPADVTVIGSYAFEYCTGLTSVTIPNSVTSIGEGAFPGCTGLTKVNITDLAAWCKISFFGWYSNPLYYAEHLYLNGAEVKNLMIPNSATSVGSYAFYKCTGLTSVTIPDSVTEIGSYAFSGCSGLTLVNIFDLAAWCNISFGNYAANPLCCAKHLYLNGMEVRGDLVIPDGVTSIGLGAFCNCTELTSVTIGNGVTSIGYEAFENCTGLERITIPFVGSTKGGTSNTHFGYLFGASSYSNNKSYVPASLKEVVITGGTSIPSYAFYGCTGLTSVTIPDSVTEIKLYAFYGCTGLTGITIPDSVTSIGSRAFYNCTGLTIYCEATSKPSGWDSNWNASNRPVVWGYVPPVGEITAVSLTLAADLTVRFKATCQPDAVVRVTMNGATTELAGEWNGSVYVFSYSGISPQYIGDKMTAELIEDGAVVSTVSDYCILDYCDYVVNSTPSALGLSASAHGALKTLLADLLNYGAEAQKYMNYKTDSPVNAATWVAECATVTPVLPTASDLSATSSTESGTGFRFAKLQLGDKVRIGYKFAAASDGLTVKILREGVEIAEYSAEALGADGDLKVVYTDWLLFTDFRTVYTAVLMRGDTEIQRCDYSVNSYVFTAHGDSTVGSLVTAMNNYGVSASAYVGA